MSNNLPKIFVISDLPNAAVVQLENRKYPGLVIQGDTLNNVVRLLVDCASCIERNDTNEASDIIAELKEILGGMNNAYRKIVTL